MNFFKFWQGRNGKASSKASLKAFSDEDLLGFDLLFQLSYMSAIASSGISRDHIFDLASQLELSSSSYFREVHLLHQKMNYGYAEACQLVGQSTKQEEIKSLLLRLSASLSSGQPERDFLAQETQVQAEVYGNEYERRLETLRKWTDGYIALLISAALIVVVAVVSMVIYPMETAVIGGMIAVLDTIGALGAWIIYRIAPKEIKPLPAALGPKGDRFCRSLLYVLGSAGAIACGLLSLRGVPLGWILIAASLFLLPVGLVSRSYDRKVDKRDEEISTFLRSLGRVASAIGTTVTQALDRIDARSMGSLEPAIKNLRVRLQSRLNPQLSWQKFVVETESELINRTVRAFQDAIQMGGDPETVGFRASFLATKVYLLRAKRRLVCTSFANLLLVMHATVVGILIFILEIVRAFGQTVKNISLDSLTTGMKGQQSGAMASLLTFNVLDVGFFYSVLVPAILVLCVLNAVAAKAAEGGHNFKLFYYSAITLASTGAALVLVPKVTSMLFKTTAA